LIGPTKLSTELKGSLEESEREEVDSEFSFLVGVSVEISAEESP